MDAKDTAGLLTGNDTLDTILGELCPRLDGEEALELAREADRLEATRPQRERMEQAERLLEAHPELERETLMRMAEYGTAVPGLLRTKLLFDLAADRLRKGAETELERLRRSRPDVPPDALTSPLR